MTRLQTNKEPKDLRPRSAAAAVIATALFLLLVARLYHLQLVRGPELSAKSRENYIKELVEPAPRGLVLDHYGRIIADNRPSFDVYVTPAFCKHAADVIGRLSDHLNLSFDETANVLKAIKASRGLDRFRPYLVKLDITRDQLDVIEADLARLEGVDIIPSAHRSYRYGEELAHVVGYMSEVSQTELDNSKGRYRRGDFIGRRGLERSMEQELRGIDGRRRIAVDAKGRELDQETADLLIPEADRLVPPKPGHNIVLSIDLGLQHIAEQALKAEGRAGAVVAVDVHTGFVLAMVSEPSYDPNKMTGRISRKDLMAIVDDPLQPLFQRDVQQNYHPGSTFKVVTALAALEKGIVTPESATGCGGGYTLGPRRWRCWADKGHGPGIGLRRALIQSCDTYFYWLADRMGLDPIASMGERLGFGRTTGVELSPEAPGIMPTVEFHERVDHGYTKGYALNAAIGQGAVNVSPIQLAMAYAALANGGTLYKPHLVRRIEDAAGSKPVLVREIQPEVVNHIDIKPVHLTAIMEGLAGVVSTPGGTAYSKRLAHISVAGKTGTAQNVVIGEKRTKLQDMEWAQRDHAWFASIAPVDNPEIAVVVLNEHGGHGGAAAAPVAMAVIQGYFDLKAREADQKQILSEQEIMELQPAPQYASALVASRGSHEPSPGTAPVAPTGPISSDEPQAPSDEVADPSLLLPPQPAAPPASTQPHEAEIPRPVPE